MGQKPLTFTSPSAAGGACSEYPYKFFRQVRVQGRHAPGAGLGARSAQRLLQLIPLCNSCVSHVPSAHRPRTRNTCGRRRTGTRKRPSGWWTRRRGKRGIPKKYIMVRRTADFAIQEHKGQCSVFFFFILYFSTFYFPLLAFFQDLCYTGPVGSIILLS